MCYSLNKRIETTQKVIEILNSQELTSEEKISKALRVYEEEKELSEQTHYEECKCEI